MKIIYTWFSSIYFWKVYFKKEEDSIKDEKLSKIVNLLPSNLILFFALFMGIMSLFINEETGMIHYNPTPVFILCLFLFILHFSFQYRTCYNALKRVIGISSLRAEVKKGLSFLKDFSILSIEFLVEDLKDVIDEFFEGYDERNNTQQESQKSNHNKQNQSYSNENYSDHKANQSDIEKIFIKYNIPQDSGKDEIKRIFRSLAKKYHPDMPTGDEKLFIELREDLEYLIKHLNMSASA